MRLTWFLSAKSRVGFSKSCVHLARVLEADLANFHGAIFLEIGPRGIDDGNVVLLIAWRMSELNEDTVNGD